MQAVDFITDSDGFSRGRERPRYYPPLMKLKTAFLTLSTAAVLLATATFAGELKKDIVGKWADADGVENIEYKADGTFVETMAGGDVIKGKYSFPDDKSIKVEFEGPMAAAGAVVSPITIKGDEMSVTGIDGTSVMTYQRQK